MIPYIKFKSCKQNKVLLKDTTQCDKLQRKARVLDFCLREGGEEGGVVENTAGGLKSIVTFDFSHSVEGKWALTLTSLLYHLHIYSTPKKGRSFT